MCFRDHNVEYLDQPARQTSFKSEATTLNTNAGNEADEAKAALKAAAKAERKAKREKAAAIRRKALYGGGSAAFMGIGAGCG
ncbi:hypothetical protein TWF730_000648 [Orbilia blumenaviensis]|uniref:Uncharacterized protein n=1 Tax=Orbilia blumenaviensis TaxID=1796055 RepID=A0AAV9VPZ6_9PEZI